MPRMVLLSRYWTVILILSTVWCAGSVLWAEDTANLKKETLVFTGKSQGNEPFDFFARIRRNMTFFLKVPGAAQPGQRSENVDVSATGELVFTQLNEAGNPVHLEFLVHQLNGNINGAAVEFSALKGRTIIADLSGLQSVFSLKKSKKIKDQELSDLLGTPGSSSMPTPANEKETDTLSPHAILLLRTLFQPAGQESLADLLGKEQHQSMGGQWEINTKPLVKALTERDLKIDDKSIQAFATFLGRVKQHGFDLWSIRIRMESGKVQGYDFRYDARILFPTDPKIGGPISISKDVTEVVDTPLPQDNPLAAGNSISVISKELSELLLIPKNKPKETKKEKSREKRFWLF